MNANENSNIVDRFFMETTIRLVRKSFFDITIHSSVVSKAEILNLFTLIYFFIFSASDWWKNQSIQGVISSEKIDLFPVSKVKQISIRAKEPTRKVIVINLFFLPITQKHHFAHT